MRNKPIPFALFLQSPDARREAWRRKFTMDDLYRDAAPTRGHHGIAALVATGKMPAVITQNIDNLHQASGLSDDQVIELHGNGTYAVCLDCAYAARTAGHPIPFRGDGGAAMLPGLRRDREIGHRFRSARQCPPGEMRAALELALACDLFLVLGSSLVVYPAASLPSLAKENGARLVIVNREPTPLDDQADIVIAGEIGPILSKIANDL